MHLLHARRRRLVGASVFGSAPGGGGYVGPGDLSGVVWSSYGSPAQALNAAYATAHGPAVDILDSAGANAATINFLSTGALDLTTLNNWITAHGTAYVVRLYDHTPAANHWEATYTGAPILLPSYIASKPTLSFLGNPQRLVTAGNITLADGVTVHMIARKGNDYGGFGNTFCELWGHAGSSNVIGFPAGHTGGIQLIGGSELAIWTDDVDHKLQVHYQTGTGTANVNLDGTNHASDAGGFFGSAYPQRLMWNGGPQVYVGEVGTCDLTGFSSALSGNVTTRWGI